MHSYIDTIDVSIYRGSTKHKLPINQTKSNLIFLQLNVECTVALKQQVNNVMM